MSRSAPALFRRWPQAAGALPWVPLGNYPTPVERPAGLAASFAPAALWLKRDDLSSPLYGGNKVRILEFLLGHALACRAEMVLTGGPIGSHHVSAAALFARELGLAAEVFLWEQPWSPRCAQALALLERLGVPVRRHRHPTVALGALLWRKAVLGRRAHLLVPGGATPRGALGFVDAALELDAQIAAGVLPVPGSLWVPCGSGVTAAGLALGLALAGRQTRVRAVRVAPLLACNGLRLRQLMAGARRLLAQAGVPAGPAQPPELLHGCFAPGYSIPNPAAEAAVALLAEQGMRGDTTYSGRALAACLARAPAEGGTHLFWHTLSAVAGV